MIVAEEKISQNGVPIAHDYILILRRRLDDGIHQDLKRESILSEHFNMNSGRQYIKIIIFILNSNGGYSDKFSSTSHMSFSFDCHKIMF